MKKLLFGFILFFVAFLFSISFLNAQPPLYHEFYGSATCEDGNPFNDHELLVKVNETEYSTMFSGGAYQIIVQGELEDVGSPVEFYVGNVLLGSSTFESFGFTNLDFVSSDNTLCGGGGGSPIVMKGGSPIIMKGNGGSPLIMKGGSDPECDDGSDNDDDGFIDYPLDPGCDDADDDDEADPEIPPSPGCENDCDAGSLLCLGDTSYDRCGHYDDDVCLEWSGELPCDEGYVCEEGVGCVLIDVGGDDSQEKGTLFDSTIIYLIGAGVLIVILITGFMIMKKRNEQKIFNKLKMRRDQLK